MSRLPSGTYKSGVLFSPPPPLQRRAGNYCIVLAVRPYSHLSHRVSTLLSISLYRLYLRNPSTDLFLLLHMERPYIGAVQRGGGGSLLLIFLENWKKKTRKLQKSVKFLFRHTIFMSLYGPYLGDPSIDSILLLYMEEHILELCNGRYFLFFFVREFVQSTS